MKAIFRTALSVLFAASFSAAALAQNVGGAGSTGGGGGTVTQGAAAGSGPWIVTPWIGGAVNASGNPLFVQLTAGAASLGTVGLNAGSNIVGKFGIDQTTPGTTNGVSLIPLTNAQGGNLTPVVSGALEANHVFKASAGNLYSAYATSTTGAAGYFVCVNATSISVGAITPIDFIAIPAGPATVGISYSPGPPGAYSTGITCAVTVAATPFTYTAPGSVIAYHGLVD
jgi:hypothetical protein